VVWDCPAILRHLKEEPFTGDAANPPFPLSQGRENRTSLSEESIAERNTADEITRSIAMEVY
jgi:hypothetical protein